MLTVRQTLDQILKINPSIRFMHICIHRPIVDNLNDMYVQEWCGEFEEIPQNKMDLLVYGNMLSPQYHTLHIYLRKVV